MPRRDFLPAADGALLAWAQGFSARLSADPAAYGIAPADAAAVADLVADYAARLAVAREPSTRTIVTVGEKNLSRGGLKARLREVARVINARPATTDPQRLELGLTPRDREPTPCPPPPTRPVVSLGAMGALRVGVRLHDQQAPDRRARPRGVAGAHLWAKVGSAPPAGTDGCTFLGTATRSRKVLTFPAADVNQTVWVLAQWVNGKGQVGPASAAASASIAA